MRMRHVVPVVAVLLAGCGGEEEPREREVAAATATATATPTAIPTQESTGPRPKRRRFRSLDEAIDMVDHLVEVPVVLPANLPDGVRVAGAGGRKGSGYIGLAIEKRRPLHIQYGEAGFDGCGPLNPRAITIGGVPGVINASDGSKPPHIAIVWPATVKEPTGRYGVSGQFPREKLVAWAESMQQRAQAARAGRHKPGC
jgi:hypothetical protein